MRLLIVEDEPELAKVLAQALREENYAVDTAADGEEGLAKAMAWNYDAIILDVMLPRMTGWQVLENLRKSKPTPVLMLTARDTVVDRVKGLDTGADDYLVKPFDLNELFARLRSVIRRAAGKPSPRITIGQVEIDTSSKTITRAGEAITLTAREYTLVEILALRRGEVVSRTTLYEHLFDETDDTLSNLLDVHVSNIRRKIGPDLIQTRRGQGYVIDG
jgi:two-component system, OmpR family, response regulator